MYKKILCIISILLIVISIIKIKPSFSSEKAIYYDASSKKFTYYNISKEDVFDEFKNLMPGDSREQIIKIKVINQKENTNMYLKIDFEENKDLINNLNINIYKNDNEIIKNNEMFKIFDEKDNEINLKIKLDVPTSLGNEIQKYNNSLKMNFYIEENNDLIEIPQTFDNIIYYYILLFISLILLVISIIKFKDKEENN